MGEECGEAQGSRSQMSKVVLRWKFQVSGECASYALPYMYALYVCLICSKVVLRWKLQADGECGGGQV